AITDLAFNPPAPGTSDLLQVTTTAADADGEALTYTYTWSVNDVVKQTTPNVTSTTDTFDLSLAGQGDAGQTVKVEVTPFAGGVAGTKVSRSVVIGNSAPVIDTVTFTPTTAFTNDQLTANVAASDVDGNQLRYTYTWKVNDQIVQTTPNTLSA